MKTILSFAFVLVASTAFGSISDQVAKELIQPVSLSQPQLEKIRSTQFIFVDGIFGDLMKANFAPAVDMIQTQWANSDVQVIRPLTANPIEVNAEILYGQIKTLRENSPNKEAVIIAHSKGGTEIMLMALRHPDVITKMGVKNLDIVSAPMQGTDIASAITTGCGADNPICAYLNKLLPSVQGFMPEVINPLYSTALHDMNFINRPLVERTVFYVRTLMSDDDVTSPLWVTHEYLDAHDGNTANDGLIPTANEELLYSGKVYGTDLGVMIGDHNSLLDDTIIPKTLTYRQTFFRVLMEQTLLAK